MEYLLSYPLLKHLTTLLMKIINDICKCAIITLIGLLSCTREETFTEIEVYNKDVEQYLEGNKILSIEHSCIIDMYLYDSLLLINTQTECYPYIFHTYSYPGFKYLGSMGSSGNGPDEYFEGRFSLSHDSMGVWTIDLNHKKLKHIDPINEKVIKTLLFPKECGMLESNTYVDEEFILGKSLSHSLDSYFKYDIQNDSLNIVSNIPRLKYQARKDLVPILYSASTDYDPINHKFIVAYEFFGQIDVFNLKNGIKTSCFKIIDDKNVPDWRMEYATVVPPDAWHYFSDIESTKDNIFVLLNYYQMKEVLYPDSIRSCILKLDWKGNLTSKFILDKHIDKFNYDTESKMFICLSRNSDTLYSFFAD